VRRVRHRGRLLLLLLLLGRRLLLALLLLLAGCLHALQVLLLLLLCRLHLLLSVLCNLLRLLHLRRLHLRRRHVLLHVRSSLQHVRLHLRWRVTHLRSRRHLSLLLRGLSRHGRVRLGALTPTGPLLITRRDLPCLRHLLLSLRVPLRGCVLLLLLLRHPRVHLLRAVHTRSHAVGHARHPRGVVRSHGCLRHARRSGSQAHAHVLIHPHLPLLLSVPGGRQEDRPYQSHLKSVASKAQGQRSETSPADHGINT
jgi:hypothetical protein